MSINHVLTARWHESSVRFRLWFGLGGSPSSEPPFQGNTLLLALQHIVGWHSDELWVWVGSLERERSGFEAPLGVVE